MDMLIYNQVKDVGARIRQFVAGEAITQGQILTSHLGSAIVNRRRTGLELAFTNAEGTGLLASCAINSTQSLILSGASNVVYLNVVTCTNDGNAPYNGAMVSLVCSGSTGFPSIKKLTATTFLVYCGGVLAVATVSGTNVTLGTIITGGSSSYQCGIEVFSPTQAVLYSSGSTYFNTWLVTITGTTITLGSSTVTTMYIANIVNTQVSTMTVKLSSTAILIISAYGVGIFTINGTTVAGANITTYLSSSEGVWSVNSNNMYSIVIVDALHVIISTGSGIYVGTINASYTTITFNQPLLPIIKGSLLLGYLVSIDATHFLLYNAYGNCIITANTSILGNVSISMGPMNTLVPSKCLPSSPAVFNFCPLSLSNILFLTCGNTSTTYAQTLFIVDDTVDNYSLNLGIAMNTVANGGTVNVLMAGGSPSIYTGLTPGAKYSNFDGTLVRSSAPNNIIAPAPFNLPSAGSNVTFPPLDTKQAEISPYAVAITSTEILIIEPLNRKGVTY